MKFIIFCLLISFHLSSPVQTFRFKNGTFTKGNNIPTTISGSLYHFKVRELIIVMLCGMDYSTMTPLIFVSGTKNKTTTDIELKLDCWTIQHGLEERELLSGTAVLTGSWEKAEFKAECYTPLGDRLMFKSSNVKSETIYYSQKEAGLRAKFLIDQPTSKYRPDDVVYFAIFDYPYADEGCEKILSSFPDAPGPEPGAIMVGKDGRHCAILDNEGTKFIQSNFAAKKVTYDSIALAQKYFPNGIYYKRYPE